MAQAITEARFLYIADVAAVERERDETTDTVRPSPRGFEAIDLDERRWWCW